jgi:NADH dehydrogenase FAD-containing subunit
VTRSAAEAIFYYQLLALRERLKDTPAHLRFLVVDGGPTGIESAAEFAASFP